MTRLVVWLAAALLSAGAAGASGFRFHSHATSPPPTAAMRTQAEIRDLDIEFYRRRAERDPGGALDLARLGALYLQRARETGSYEDLLRAEDASRHSLRNRRVRNGAAAQLLATSLMAEHRFVEAYSVAHDLFVSDSSETAYRGLLAEIELELGKYAEARTTFLGMSSVSRSPDMTARYARWLEIEGKNEEAHQLLVDARAEVDRLSRVPPEQLAWFDLRVGDIALRNGRIEEAERAFQAGLEVHPDDYRLLAAMARLESARGDWAAAIRFGEQAMDIALDPATLGFLSDAYAARGDSAKAAEYRRVMELTVLKQPGAYHRAWSLFLLDHDSHLSQVLAKAEEELRTRKDIYGYDLVAWAQYKLGHYAEAQAAMRPALAQGTRDAMLFYHAGMISRAAGHTAAARHSLQQALEVNPYFHPTQPAVARAVLDSLSR